MFRLLNVSIGLNIAVMISLYTRLQILPRTFQQLNSVLNGRDATAAMCLDVYEYTLALK